MTSVSFVARVCVALLAREPLKYHYFAEPLLHRLCRRSAPTRPGGTSPWTTLTAAICAPSPIVTLVIQANARAQHNKILKS